MEKSCFEWLISHIHVHVGTNFRNKINTVTNEALKVELISVNNEEFKLKP